MSLTINSRSVGEVRVQGVNVRPVLGAYELILGLDIAVAAETEEPRRASIAGARVKVKSRGDEKDLGIARPEAPLEIETGSNPNRFTPGLFLILQPAQIGAIEALRDAGDLTFTLQFFGMGTTVHGAVQIYDRITVPVPQSDWIRTLRNAGARDSLLLEVPIPLQAPSEEWQHAIESLKQAEVQYRHGDYHACVNACRTVIQELGYLRYAEEDWSNPLLNLFTSGRRNMSKPEREGAMWAAIRHYTHQSHHGESEGGTYDYSRGEAQLILTLAAAFARHLQAG